MATAADRRIPQREALSRLVRMMQRDIARSLEPDSNTSETRNTLSGIASMLDQLGSCLSPCEDSETESTREALINRLGGGAQTPAATSKLQPDPMLQPDFDDASGNGSAVAELISTRPTPSSGGPGMIREIAAAELAGLNRRRAAIESRKAKDAAELASLEVAVTPQLLDRYFGGAPQFCGMRTRSISRVLGGYSKDTYLISLAGSDGTVRDIVLRRDFPFGPSEGSAPDEYDVLARLFEANFAVPRPLAAVRDRAVLGQPFLIVERIEGENAAELFDKDRKLARSVALQLARLLGRLHAMDPRALGIKTADGGTPGDQIRSYLFRWKTFWEKNRQTRAPLPAAAFAWLESHVPHDVSRLVPVHGDARQNNVMIKDGEITALLDWEYMHAGDAAEDLEYTRMYLEPYVAWIDFVRAYREAGGAETTSSSSRYYQVFRALRNFICCDVMWHGFATGRYPVNTLAMGGFVYRNDFQRSLGEALLDVTR
jgi:aminoglycoside phosphotransferase (APT) family kinase protein